MLLHFHPDITAPSTAVFSPHGGGEPIRMASTQVGYYDQFVEWCEHVDEDRSLVFVDGIVTFE